VTGRCGGPPEAGVVTAKAPNLIDAYEVDGDTGLASGPSPQASRGATPFGFAFDRRGHLIVSEAFGGAADQRAVSSYSVPSGAPVARQQSS
jgi:6-phosphogluconolactonase